MRTYIYNDDKTKKTLVLTHGFGISCVFYSRILPALAKHYRIVMFDNLANGLNTRMTDIGDALDSAEKAEGWMVEWWKKVIDALDLPPKFYLSAQSAGCYQSMLYVSAYPERIEALFLQSSPCVTNENRPGFKYDPYSYRLNSETGDLPSRKEVDAGIRDRDNDIHFFAAMHGMPYWLLRPFVRKMFRGITSKEIFSDAWVNAASAYMSYAAQRVGRQDLICLKYWRWFDFPVKTLFTRDRMLQDFDFPIAFVYGTRDHLGSAEGADEIVKNNRHFSSGRSQIFKLHNSGHVVFWDNPDGLTAQMIGFFEGTISHTFDLKPRKEFVPD